MLPLIVLLRRTAFCHHLRELIFSSMIVQLDHCPSARNTRLCQSGLTSGRQWILLCRPSGRTWICLLPCSQVDEQSLVSPRSVATTFRSRWPQQQVPGYYSSHSEPHNFEDSTQVPLFTRPLPYLRLTEWLVVLKS